jgi:hypothetical protein
LLEGYQYAQVATFGRQKKDTQNANYFQKVLGFPLFRFVQKEN